MLFIYILVMYALLGALGLVVSTATVLVMGLLYYVLYAVGSYMMFTKANKPGWWAFIPLFNEYQLFKMAWDQYAFWAYFILNFFNKPNSETGRKSFFAILCGIIVFGIELVFTNKLARAYGKGTAFGLGLLFFQPIFIMILGLGDSEYLGPQM